MKTGYQLRKKATKEASGTTKLQNEEGLDPISFRPPLEQTVEPPAYRREALPSRVIILNQVMDALNDPNLHMIGILGVGGVGKTTLVKEVLRKAVEDMLFDYVVMVAVSQTSELKRIQGEIADFLGLKFDSEDIAGRASLLYKRLKNSKVLIILDDIWAKLDLKFVGIPHGDEDKGGKILLTSRSKDVLCHEMGTQKDFLLEVLSEEEAWRLFEMTISDDKDPQLKAMATEIAKKCAGLPLLILMVATYLRNKESYVWHNMLKELSEFNHEEINERVNKVLRSIYQNLPGEEVKSFFLLCALCGNSNIRIENLVKYSIGLGMLKDLFTIEEARDRVLRWISKLKDECLLLDGHKKGCVTMQDVVRETALSIAHEVQNAFVVRSGVRLWEWPSKDCTRIALPLCDIDCLAQGLECPEAELLLLFTEDCCLEIPDSFFEGIRKLKVVDLTGIRFGGQVPSSLGFLTNLQTLCLEECQLDDIAIIGELKQLECLSFARSNIVELPREIKQLRQLKLLDLSKCSQLKVIPVNVLSELFLLEELYMSDSFVGWDEEGKASVMELDELSHLTTLEIQVNDAKKIPNHLFSKGLLRYTIIIGDEWDFNGTYEASKTVKLRQLTIDQMEHGLKKLLKGTEALYLSEITGIDDKVLQQLKHLHVRNDDAILYIINSIILASCQAFLMLTLSLLNLNSLEEISHGQLATGSFSKLRTLNISGCNNLRNLFSYSFAKCLSQLQEVIVKECDNMELIIAEGSGDGNYSNDVIEFTQLSSLELWNLPRLRSIFSKMVSFPKLTRLDVLECKSLKYICKTSTVKSLLQLKRLKIYKCEHMKEIILTEETEEEKESFHKIVFSDMDFLCLDTVSRLIRFSSGYPIEFQSLRQMYISKCLALKNLVDSSSDNQSLFNEMGSSDSKTLMLDFKNSFEFSNEGISGLKVIELSHLKDGFPFGFLKQLYSLEKLVLTSSSLECIESILFDGETSVAEEEDITTILPLKYLKVEFCDNLKYIAQASVSFQNLTTLHVSMCGNLKNLITISIAKTMIHLMQLRIAYCERMKEIVANDEDDTKYEIIFNHLKHLELQYLPTLDSFCSGNYAFHFPLLEQLIVEQCLRMKIFCCGVLSTPKLRGVRDWKYPKYEEEVQYWEGNLNATIASKYFRERALQNAYRWCVIEDPSSSKAILGNQLQLLNNLRYIYVRDCDSIQVVFDLEDASVEHCPASLLPKLEELQLINLPKLSEIWNKYHVRMFDFRMLRLLKVQNCSNLKYAFTPSTVSSLFELQEIEVKNCKMMKAIIQEEEATKLPKMRFPSLKRISIKGCPTMKGFISPTLSREQNPRPNEEENEITAPKLEELRIDWDIIKYKLNDNNQPYFSSRLKVIELVFPSNSFPALEELILSDFLAEEIIINGLDNHHKLLPRLRKIILSHLPNLRHVVHDNDPRIVSIFQNLQVLQVWECNNLKTLVPSFVYFQNLTFLQVSTCDGLINLMTASTAKSLVQLKKMCIGRCRMMQEIVAVESNEEEDEIGFFQLEYLVLDDLPCLINFCSDKNYLDFPCLEEVFVIKCPNMMMLYKVLNTPKLQVLHVWECSSLRTLVPAFVYFQNLTFLQVSNCDKLINLIIASTAKSLVQLKTMYIGTRMMMEEIVVVESNREKHEISFPQLEYLVLDDLPRLTSFCSSKNTFSFPCLEELFVIKCPKMKMFAQAINTPKLSQVQTGGKKYEWKWKNTLNSTIKALSMEMVRTNYSPKPFMN